MVLFFTVSWEAPWRRADYIVLQPVDTGDALIFVPGTREERANGPKTLASGHETSRPATAATPPPPHPAPPTPPSPAVAAAAAATPQRDTAVTMPAYDPNASLVAPAPQVGDGRLWVSPRPALPAPVAAALYGDTAAQHSAAIERLRAMVDSLNQILDQMQSEKQRPKWTVGGTPEKPEWGIDSAYIHIAGIKIPTPALALLGNLLPPGNFDEEMRMRQLNYMREDILQAANRAQSLREFKRYVHELRDRRQAEHDAEERRRAQDTVKAVP
ncbi:MAG TPA: hypothetical protein VGU74_01975 [Gemmatimonadales bacterium]|nr:hypothetical protein [Gemmatimonadales bacterium]